MRKRRNQNCRTCKHDRSVHKYDPADQGRSEPRKCDVPDCTCTLFVWRDAR